MSGVHPNIAATKIIIPWIVSLIWERIGMLGMILQLTAQLCNLLGRYQNLEHPTSFLPPWKKEGEVELPLSPMSLVLDVSDSDKSLMDVTSPNTVPKSTACAASGYGKMPLLPALKCHVCYSAGTMCIWHVWICKTLWGMCDRCCKTSVNSISGHNVNPNRW